MKKRSRIIRAHAEKRYRMKRVGRLLCAMVRRGQLKSNRLTKNTKRENPGFLKRFLTFFIGTSLSEHDHMKREKYRACDRCRVLSAASPD
jgi:hypothetical protein